MSMVMPRDDHEALLQELLSPELEHTRRTEVLQALRADYSSVTQEHEEHTKKLEKQTNEINDLVTANSKLFRQVGIVDGDESKKKEEEQKSFSETITLEELEK